MTRSIPGTKVAIALAVTITSTILLASAGRWFNQNPPAGIALLKGGTLVDSRDVVRQDGGTACGRAALIQLYRELGFDQPPRSLPEPDPRMGLSLLQLQEAASKDHVGLNGERLDTGELEDLPYPFIAWFDRNHFVVVEEMTEDGRVSVLDPAIGRVLYYPKLLQLHWDGTALVPRESEGRS